MIIAAPLRVAHGAEVETPSSDGNTAADTVKVTDIEIDDYKDVISVDETLELAVTVLPSDATEQTVSYTSGNEKILTVNSKGRVKGIAPGTTTVTITAGGLTKRISITVRVATEYIDADSTYLVLKTGDTHRVKAKAVPGGASQALVYKSLNPKVADVTKAGVIKARSPGSASILVSNDETSVAITVIVNEGTAAAGSAGQADTPDAPGGAENEQPAAEYAVLVASSGDSGRAGVSVSDYPVLTEEILSELSLASASLELQGAGYSLWIFGGDIVNTENELETGITFAENPDGVEFLLNGGHNLPGRIKLTVTDPEMLKKYIYLQNDAKKKYELLDVKEGNTFTLDRGGNYLLSDEKIGGFGFNRPLIIAAAIVMAVAIAAFIIIKRRYWFW
jgi:hypothetical protein